MIDGKRSTKAEMDALDEKRIDHINVLKGKAATEIYGAEGKNGVIEIKTKKPVLLDVVVKTEAQTEPDDKPFDVVEQMPSFPGGKEALMKFISENVKYPKEAEEKGLQGRVVVRYIIEKDGSISEVEIAKSVNEYLDAEAIRVVNAMPKWIPGKQKGEPVRVKFTLPITFRLS
jgi:TonB family protein